MTEPGFTTTTAGSPSAVTRDSPGRSEHEGLSIADNSVLEISALGDPERTANAFHLEPPTDTLNVERSLIDLAVRYCKPETVPEGAVRLFGEEMIPVCRRALLRDKTRPLKRPRDLAHHTLLD